MNGSRLALNAANRSASSTTMLTTPIVTGLRSRKGFIALPPRNRGAERFRGVLSWAGTRRNAAVPVERDTLHLEVTEIEVEPGAVRRGAQDRSHLRRHPLDDPLECVLTVAVARRTERRGDLAQARDVGLE